MKLYSSFENWQTWISRCHKCFMLDLICTIAFFGSWQHGIFFIIKDFVSKILKGKRLFGQGCLRVLDKSKNFQELQQTFEKLEDSESSFWGQRGQLRCDGLLMWQRCNTLKKKTWLKAIIIFEVTEDDGNIH